MNNSQISSIIIAKNEEKNIRRCIESQLDCIDDIVILVDKDSDDSTLDIVKEYPQINFEIAEWQGYADTKQFALSRTKYDWVFWIDADEEISLELKKELIEFKNSDPHPKAFKVARRAFFLGKWIKHSGWYPAYAIRLFNKNFARFSGAKVHEYLIVEGEIGLLKNDLNHYTDPSLFHYFEKFNRYTTLAAEELASDKRKVKMSDILIRPPFLFLKMYFLRAGFLDGLHGLILALLSSTYVFVKYCKLWELNNKNDIA